MSINFGTERRPEQHKSGGPTRRYVEAMQARYRRMIDNREPCARCRRELGFALDGDGTPTCRLCRDQQRLDRQIALQRETRASMRQHGTR